MPGDPRDLIGKTAAYMAARGPRIEAALEAALPHGGALPGPLHEAMRYSLFAGGKRIRPLVVLASAEAVGGDPDPVLPVACAVELIHTYSLIHDDLPCMDDSALRRGRPTCHVAFGEALATLAGDALHALAFELVARTAGRAGAEPTLRAICEIAAAIGTQGMVGGQVLDLLAEGRPSLARFGAWPPNHKMGVYSIHRWKTAALIRACVRSGAILAGATVEQLADLTGCGEHLGLAFQIVDDILDETGDSGVLGKETHRDAAGDKLTFPFAFGLERSRAIAQEETALAIAALAGWGPSADLLRGLAHMLLDREG